MKKFSRRKSLVLTLHWKPSTQLWGTKWQQTGDKGAQSTELLCPISTGGQLCPDMPLKDVSVTDWNTWKPTKYLFCSKKTDYWSPYGGWDSWGVQAGLPNWGYSGILFIIPCRKSLTQPSVKLSQEELGQEAELLMFFFHKEKTGSHNREEPQPCTAPGLATERWNDPLLPSGKDSWNNPFLPQAPWDWLLS